MTKQFKRRGIKKEYEIFERNLTMVIGNYLKGQVTETTSYVTNIKDETNQAMNGIDM